MLHIHSIYVYLYMHIYICMFIYNQLSTSHKVTVCFTYIFYFFLLIFLMNLKMICISNHNIMLLATSLLRIYPSYVLYGKYEIGDCLYVIVFTLFYYSSYPSLYVNFVYMLNIC